MPKSSKKFVLSDESVNNNGFIVASDGLDLAQFKRNPVLLWMHRRAESGKKDDVLPLGYWEDLELGEDGVLTGVPVFDDKDEFAMSIYNKVEDGIIRMTSLGLTPMAMEEMSAGEFMSLRAKRTGRNPSTGADVGLSDRFPDPDEKLLVLTKSFLREISMVDVGSNHNAIVLYDAKSNIIDLSDKSSILTLAQSFTKTNLDNMNIELKAVAAELQLAEDAKPAAIVAAVQALKADKAAADQALVDLQLATVKKEIDIFLSAAVAEKKITEGMKAHYIKLSGESGESFEAVKSLINEMPAAVSLADKTKEKAPEGGELDNLIKLSYSDLDKQGKLPRLKELSLEAFKNKFKEQYGSEYAGK